MIRVIIDYLDNKIMTLPVFEHMIMRWYCRAFVLMQCLTYYTELDEYISHNFLFYILNFVECVIGYYLCYWNKLILCLIAGLQNR